MRQLPPLCFCNSLVRYTARYEDFCKGGDKVKKSSSEFWEEQQSRQGKSWGETKVGKNLKGEVGASVASGAFGQLHLTEPKEVRAPKAHRTHHAKEDKGSNGMESDGEDARLHGEHHRPRPARRRSSSVTSLFGQSVRRRSSHAEDAKLNGRDLSAGRVAECVREENPYVATFRRFISAPPSKPFSLCLLPLLLTHVFAAKYDDLTEKLDSFIADSLACKTSLAALSLTDDERQRVSLLDANASCSSFKLNKYLSRKFEAESSKKQLEDKLSSKQFARLRRLGKAPAFLHPDDIDAAYKTPRPNVPPAMFAAVETKNEVTLSRPQTSMKKRIEEMGANVDTIALGVGVDRVSGSGGGGDDDVSASSNVVYTVNRLLLKSNHGGMQWCPKDLPLIESARARTEQMRPQSFEETCSTPLHSHSLQSISSQSISAALNANSSSAQIAHASGASSQSPQPHLTPTASPQTPTSSRRLLRTSKQQPTNLPRLGHSPSTNQLSDDKGGMEPVASKKKTLSAEEMDAMAHRVLDTFYTRLLKIYRSDCAHFKCAEVTSFVQSLQQRRTLITPTGSGQNDLSLVCAPLANVIPYVPQARVLEVHDYYINAAASEQLLCAVLRSPQLRVLQFQFCRVSLDCCAAVGLALSRDDAEESDAHSAGRSSAASSPGEQRKPNVMFKIPDDSSGTGAALQVAAADMAGEADSVLGQQTQSAANKVKNQVLEAAAKSDESDGGSDGDDIDRRPAAIRLARLKRIQKQQACMLDKGLPNLVVLKMCRCNLTGVCVAALCVGLTSNRGVKTLHISHNSIGDNRVGCESLGKLLAVSSTLTDVSIGHNHINHHGSLDIVRGLLGNSTLQRLDVQANLFGSEATQAVVAESLRSPCNAITHLNVRNCGLDAISAVILSDGILAAPRLKHLDVSHNMLGKHGSHAFLFAHGIMCNAPRQRDWAHDSLVIVPLLAAAGALSPQKGAKATPQSDVVFDVADFPGQHTLKLGGSGGYHSSLLRWLLYFETIGRACISSMRSTRHEPEELEELLQQLRTCAKSVGVWTMPLESVSNRSVIVTCQSVVDMMPNASNTLSLSYLHSFEPIITASSAVDEMNAASFVPALLPLHSWVSVSHALSALKLIKRSTERVSFCAFALIALVEAQGREEMVAALSHTEQQLLKKRLSKSATEWTPFNMTGHWKLDLGDAVDRRIGHTLCSALRITLNTSNECCADALGFSTSGLPFLPKTVEPCDLWRNAQLVLKDAPSIETDHAAVAKSRPSTASATKQELRASSVEGQSLPTSQHHELPRVGNLEVDFVCVHRPRPPACAPLDLASWQLITDNVAEVLQTGDFVAMQHELLKLRYRSNSIYLQSEMLHQLLHLFKLPSQRADIVVMFYFRVTDWVGLQHKLMNWLSDDVFVTAVGARIGFTVAFDDFSLVGYYDLQLELQDHRKLLKRILIQTNDAIGFEIHDWVYDGVRDDYPVQWVAHVDIPRKSFVTFRVCCSAQLVHAVTRACAPALPADWGTLQPAGHRHALVISHASSLSVDTCFRLQVRAGCRNTKSLCLESACWAERKYRARSLQDYEAAVRCVRYR